MSQFEDVGPDDPLDNNPGFDATGLDGVMDIMRGTFQVMTGAKLVGFTDAQAFQLCRDWFTNMMRISAEAEQGTPK